MRINPTRAQLSAIPKITWVIYFRGKNYYKAFVFSSLRLQSLLAQDISRQSFQLGYLTWQELTCDRCRHFLGCSILEHFVSFFGEVVRGDL